MVTSLNEILFGLSGEKDLINDNINRFAQVKAHNRRPTRERQTILCELVEMMLDERKSGA